MLGRKGTSSAGSSGADPGAQAELGRHLKSLRLRAGYSQTEIADELGVDQPTLARVESGERPLSFVEAVSLTRLYNVPLESLVSPETQPPPRFGSGLRITEQPASSMVTRTALSIKGMLEEAIAANTALTDEGLVPAPAGAGEVFDGALSEAVASGEREIEFGYQAARALRRRWPALALARDMESVCEQLGVVLLQRPIGVYERPRFGAVGGAALSQASEGYILANSQLPRAESQRLIAELLSTVALGQVSDGELAFGDGEVFATFYHSADSAVGGSRTSYGTEARAEELHRTGARWGFVHEVLMPAGEVLAAVDAVCSPVAGEEEGRAFGGDLYDLASGPDAATPAEDAMDERVANVVRIALALGCEDLMNAARHVGHVIDEDRLRRLGFESWWDYSAAVHHALLGEGSERPLLDGGRLPTKFVHGGLGPDVGSYVSPITRARAFAGARRGKVGAERLAEVMFVSVREAERMVHDVAGVYPRGD